MEIARDAILTIYPRFIAYSLLLLSVFPGPPTPFSSYPSPTFSPPRQVTAIAVNICGLANTAASDIISVPNAMCPCSYLSKSVTHPCVCTHRSIPRCTAPLLNLHTQLSEQWLHFSMSFNAARWVNRTAGKRLPTSVSELEARFRTKRGATEEIHTPVKPDFSHSYVRPAVSLNDSLQGTQSTAHPSTDTQWRYVPQRHVGFP